MNHTELIRSLRESAEGFDSASRALYEIADAMERIPRLNASERIMSVVRCAEQSAVRLRSAAARAHPGGSPAFYRELGSVLGVEVAEETKWIRIRVPAVLPHKKEREATDYIVRPLRTSLIHFQRATPIPRFRDCVIAIVHSYDGALSLQRIRDYDNVETKRYLDVIEAAFLTNDTGLLCSVVQTTEVADRDCTDFYLMQPETLPLWAREHIRSRT